MIDSFDWSKTALGPRERWPQSLRTTVEIMASSKFAMCAGWGPDLIMIYNDAYAPILGARHPAALGTPWREAWPDVWNEIEPLIDRALAGESVWFEEMHLLMTRNGFGEDTWWNFSYSPLRDDSGAIVGFLDVVGDATAKVLNERRLEEERHRLSESEARLRALLNASSDVVYRMSADWQEMRQLDGRGFLADTEAPSIRWMDAYLPDEDRPQVMAAIDKAIGDKGPFELEHRVRQADGTIGWTLSRAVPILGGEGEILEWFGMATDITQRRQTDEYLRLVVNELNHRVKNNLAMVQAIAMQTFRGADEPGQALDRFTARLIALAQANDLLTGERWAGVNLDGVLEQAVRSHCDDPRRIRIEGPALEIPAKSALALSLAVHELATNATKYGAWSVPEGRVEIAWRIEGDGDGPARLHLEWREQGGPPVSPPTRRGFGSRLIERGLATELSGTVKLDFQPDGLVCRVDAALLSAESKP